MPNDDKPKALQLPGSLMERLAMAAGQYVTVYLMGVHAPAIVGAPGVCPPYAPGVPGVPAPAPGAGGAFEGPPLTPGVPPGGGHVGPLPPFSLSWECPPGKEPTPMRRTATVSGTLGFAGTDYLIIRVPVNSVCTDILIPYHAIGMIVFQPMM